ncbi:MAG: D-glycero-beta-D-manno-heptose 1-phosphate adenylyltransferase [Myxococcales bacterium]|nr:D-glycero-beta-D-manno-heptose 1-phosphate adenylyltransferase [Myxococcales bacterium]|tara:strand:- start:1131 stop:1658 length:528 start_codon:yes stop_codon:yes gene_type:complete
MTWPPWPKLTEVVGLKNARSARIISRAELAQVRVWHPNATIGLCNGAFDLFHVGHLRYLEGAAQMADILVVAVNSDASVQLSKGPQRPLVPESERLELLSSLASLDYLHLFQEKSVHDVLKALRPDFHIKGSDYTPETVPEAKLVQELGGEVRIAGDPKDHATTDVIKKIKETVL